MSTDAERDLKVLRQYAAYHRAKQAECESQGDRKGASVHDSLAQDHEDTIGKLTKGEV
jgi:hypothetical protein